MLFNLLMFLQELVKNSLACQNMVIQALAYHLKVSEDFDITSKLYLKMKNIVVSAQL